MPTAPYAKIRVAVNGGSPTTGGIVVAHGDTIALSAESTVGWGEPAARWEIYAFPSGWTGPGAPWTSEAVPQPNGSVAIVYKYLGTSPPPPFVMPALPFWGKFMLRLFVNGGIKGGAASSDLNDQATALEILSPSGLHDMAWREGSQFGAWQNWVAHYAANLRIIDAGLTTAAGAVQSVTGSSPITISGTATDPIIGISPASGSAAGSLSSAFYSVLNSRTSAADAGKLVERDVSGGCAFVTVTSESLDSPAGLDLLISRGGDDRLVFGEYATEMILPPMVNPSEIYGLRIAGTIDKDTGYTHAIFVDMTVTNPGDGVVYATFARNGLWDMCILEGGVIKFQDGATPTLNQVWSGGMTGKNFTITAQQGSTTGGDLCLGGGAGSNPGGVQFLAGGTQLARTYRGPTSTFFDIPPSAGSRFDIRTSASQALSLQYVSTKRFEIDTNGIGFFAATPVAKPTVTGSRGGNAALTSLLTALANLGLITNSSSA